MSVNQALTRNRGGLFLRLDWSRSAHWVLHWFGGRRTRLESDRDATKKLADTPALFGENRQPPKQYLAIPKTSSERRRYIPMGFLPPEVVASTELFTSQDATLYDFGVLTSHMHMAWVRSVCGRLKSDYRYSAGIVYNNFPWPEQNSKQCAAIEAAAQAVIDARAQYPKATPADLYDPLAMPSALVKAHEKLNKAVDVAYGKTRFTTEAERVAFLFELYRQITAPLDVAAPKTVRRTAKKTTA